jgi:hypothetical protein
VNQAAPDVDRAMFFALVEKRAAGIAEFLAWASECEVEPASSVRFEHRPDHVYCRSVLGRFFEPWWGVVVYSCFDSVNGTTAVAPYFAKPVPPSDADRIIRGVRFTRPSVQGHRTQVTLARSKSSLVSACEKAEALEHVLATPGRTFDERFAELSRIHVWAWRRTTNFDALARGGVLRVDGVGYRPEQAYLYGSQGPASGFERIWGIRVTRRTAPTCEQLLTHWTSEWDAVAARVGVEWRGPPYDSADLENALCVFQERRK